MVTKLLDAAVAILAAAILLGVGIWVGLNAHRVNALEAEAAPPTRGILGCQPEIIGKGLARVKLERSLAREFGPRRPRGRR